MEDVRSEVRLAGTPVADRPHISAFFRTRGDEYRVLLPFVQEGLAHREKAFHIVDPALRADHARRLRASGINVYDAEARGQLEIRTWEETYLRGGRFDQRAMLALVEQTLGDARAQGFPRTRLVAHMEWALEERPGVGDLLEYEARASAVLARYEDPVVCVYDCSRFGGELATAVVRVHPMVLIAGTLWDNALCVAPETFLGELAARRGTGTRRDPPRRFTARCVHCHHAILAGVERIGEEEAHALRDHLRACSAALPTDRAPNEHLGELLKHYELAAE